MIANSPSLINACSERRNMVNDSSEADAPKHNPHSQRKTSTHNRGLQLKEVKTELYMTFPLIEDHSDCQFLKEIKITLIVFI